ncbi:MAG: hypothetical protein OXF78_09375 [Rhodospirillales bacterium]|nr:hypothetical protein [Rhodospirillales bacterium]
MSNDLTLKPAGQEMDYLIEAHADAGSAADPSAIMSKAILLLAAAVSGQVYVVPADDRPDLAPPDLSTLH